MSEWFKEHAWKACMVVRSSRVRIPVPPPKLDNLIKIFQTGYKMRLSAFVPRSPAPSGAGRSLFKVGSLIKSTFLIFLVFSLLLFFKTPALAQTSSEAQQYQTPNVNSNVPKNLHFWTQNVMLEVMSSMICQLAGVDPINPNQQCLGVDRQTGKIGFVKNGGGAIGVTGSLIAGTFLIPVHFSDYATYAFNNFGFPKKSYAQQTGIGYTGLQPVLGLFTTFRNIAYLLMVFIFVIIGVAIMLRLRIDPRTVMTIQNQIPKLVIGLIMITFSYAIVGLLIDVMWVSTYFVINTLAPADPVQRSIITGSITEGAPGFANAIYRDNGGLLQLSINAAGGVGDVVYNMISPEENLAYRDLVASQSVDCGWNPFCHIDQFFNGAIGDLIAGVIAGILSIAARIIVLFIFIIAILVALFKLLFALLKSFITILLDTILAPFWILGGLLPGAGQSIGIGPWLRDVTANLAVFPAVVFLFLIARTISSALINQGNAASNFNPPLIGNSTGTNVGQFAALIGVGFILAAPGVVESVKKAFKASSGMPGVGKSVGVAAGIAAIPVKRVGGALFGKNKWDQPKIGSQWLGNRFGSLASFASGGGFKPEQGKAPLVRWRGIVPGKRGAAKEKPFTPPPSNQPASAAEIAAALKETTKTTTEEPPKAKS